MVLLVYGLRSKVNIYLITSRGLITLKPRYICDSSWVFLLTRVRLFDFRLKPDHRFCVMKRSIDCAKPLPTQYRII